jgi:hypothetical protein
LRAAASGSMKWPGETNFMGLGYHDRRQREPPNFHWDKEQRAAAPTEPDLNKSMVVILLEDAQSDDRPCGLVRRRIAAARRQLSRASFAPCTLGLLCVTRE